MKAVMAGVKLQVTCLLLALQCCHFGLLTASERAGRVNHIESIPSGASLGSESLGGRKRVKGETGNTLFRAYSTG